VREYRKVGIDRPASAGIKRRWRIADDRAVAPNQTILLQSLEAAGNARYFRRAE
jgi:hypothetical protein